MAKNPQSGVYRLVVDKSNWSNGLLPPHMSLQITLDIEGDEFEYHAYNDTRRGEPPYLVDFKAQVGGGSYPSTGRGIDSVDLARLSDDEYQLNKTSEGTLVATEYWRFIEDNCAVIKHGARVRDGTIFAYLEYFARQ